MVVIYVITNKINGKVYIGQTTQDIESRFKQHCSDSSCCVYLKNAISKYGKENFTIQIVEIVDSTELANQKEIDYINMYKSTDSNIGYNLKAGGNNAELTKEIKQKISNKIKLKYQDEQFRQKMSNIKKNTWKKERYKKLKKQQSKDMWENPQHKQNMKRIMLDKWTEKEYRKKVSDGLKKAAPNLKKNKQEYMKKRWENKEYRDTMAQMYTRQFRDRLSKKCGGRLFDVHKITKDNGKSKYSIYYQILQTVYVGTWRSQGVCAEELEITSKGINSCLRNKTKIYAGYVFTYKE